jgi:uncharacterized protein
MTYQASRIGRRRFLKASAGIASGAFFTSGVFDGFIARAAHAARPNQSAGYGAIAAAADLRDGELRLALPAGFSYRSFGLAGAPMGDGYLTPIGHDAMAAYPLANGNIRLIRNHEDKNAAGAGNPSGPVATMYDPAAGGGTTSLEVDPATRELVHDFISLNGTTGNCAGGWTPWGSWLTCEEVLAGPGNGWEQPHGYIYEVFASATGPVRAEPYRDMGRALWEAAVVDPATGNVYETEDNGSAGFYRFIPNAPGNLSAGGRLQMLALQGAPQALMAKGQPLGHPRSVMWVDVANPDPADAPTNSRALFDQAWAEGGASFSRLEGAWYEAGKVYFTSTDGGEAGLGQVWQYEVASETLTLIFESPSAAVLSNPDNIVPGPRGGLVLCEDSSGAEQHVRGLTPAGEIFDLALNLSNDFEWAGACWSPDGQTLFVNRQGANRGPNPPPAGDEGMTFAIWGPWGAGPL